VVAAEALLHEAPDVQARALAIVECYADAAGEDLTAALVSAAPVIAPSLRSRLTTLAGESSIAEGRPDPGTRARRVGPEVASNGWPKSTLEVTVVDALDPIAPIETPAELALVVARVLEHPEEIDELERAIDGISRLCDASRLEPAAMWAPIRKRAERRLRERDAFDRRGVVAIDFAALVAAWLDRKQPPPLDPPLTVMGFFSTRLHALARRAALGRERPLLSAPTHAGGWIDPEILVARLAGDGEPGDEADLVLALLRLAPDRRERALAAAAELPGEPAAALRFALGTDLERPRFASPTWVAAVRARFPGRDASELGPAFRKLGTGAARTARPTIAVKQEGKDVVWQHLHVSPDVEGRPPSALYPTVAMHARAQHRPWAGSWYWWGANGSGTGAESEAEVRWCATLQPIDLDPYLTEGLARIGNNLDWWEARWEQRAFLEPLLDVRTSFSGIAVRLLTLALAAKEPGIRGLAVDTTAQALTDGCLSSSTLGASLGEAWASPLVTPRRFALSLATAAAISTESRQHVRAALMLGLRTPPRADVASILELLHELCHADAVGVDDHEARSSLASYTRGKAGRLAKSLLAI
jgi:hypothetical protein